MKPALALPLLLVACATTGDSGTRLAEALAGRSAGPAVDCVPVISNQSFEIVDSRTLLYRPLGRTTWRNDLPDACPGLDVDDVLIIEPFTTSQYCRNDRIRGLDRMSRIPGALCRLGSFTPYTRP